MAQGRFPKAYVQDVKKDEAMMEYVNFESMGIGARPSGKPKTASEGPKPLEHVGNSASGKK